MPVHATEQTAWEYETAASLRQRAKVLLALRRPGPAAEYQARADAAFGAVTDLRKWGVHRYDGRQFVELAELEKATRLLASDDAVIVLRANELARTAGCTIWEYDEGREEFRLRASDYVDEDDAARHLTIAPDPRMNRWPGGSRTFTIEMAGNGDKPKIVEFRGERLVVQL